MASSVLETFRRHCEDLTSLKQAGATALAEQAKCREKRRRRKILWDHRVRLSAVHMKETATRALQLIEDDAKVFNTEIATITAKKFRTSTHDNNDDRSLSKEVWKVYYDRLKNIQDYYGRWGEQNQYPENRDASAAVCDLIDEIPDLSSIFREGEMKGKIMDLSPSFELFLNCKKYQQHRDMDHKRITIARMKKLKYEKEKKRKASENLPWSLDDVQIDLADPEVQKKLEFHEVDYVRYLRTLLTDFKSVPRHCKYKEQAYEEYISSLDTYLEDFYSRIRPLASITKLIEQTESRFEQAWTDKSITHWLPPSCEMINVYAPVTDRLFATETACKGHMQSKKYKKQEAKMTPEKLREIEEASRQHDLKLAKIEFSCSRWLEILTPYIEATIQHVRKKQSRSLAELENEPIDSEDGGNGLEDFLGIGKRQDAGVDLASDDNSDDENGTASKKVRNPLNLPLGWDGKPIPYWLYKLHGLGQEFKCEICGNQSYWGRKVFERHFQEWRHAFGMRCLKIPNTVHFKEITKIEDALALYEKLKAEMEHKSFLTDQEVEVEDAQGNVMTPQTYDDLRKQGLL